MRKPLKYVVFVLAMAFVVASVFSCNSKPKFPEPDCRVR